MSNLYLLKKFNEFGLFYEKCEVQVQYDARHIQFLIKSEV
jgi:hypothetical protein